MADLPDIRSRLEGIAEELADLALDLLREAVEQGSGTRPELEKRLTRARAAVEKAAHLLDD
ncbi:MAG TPA: hypothetical protein VGJ03_00240 [Acidimicrobiales bacterium]|jgi:hypothetical protein